MKLEAAYKKLMEIGRLYEAHAKALRKTPTPKYTAFRYVTRSEALRNIAAIVEGMAAIVEVALKDREEWAVKMFQKAVKRYTR